MINFNCTVYTKCILGNWCNGMILVTLKPMHFIIAIVLIIYWLANRKPKPPKRKKGERDLRPKVITYSDGKQGIYYAEWP